MPKYDNIADSLSHYFAVRDVVSKWRDIIPKKKPHDNSYKEWLDDKAAMKRWSDLLPFTTKEMAKHGWGDDQLPYIFELWMRESRWNYLAKNKNTLATGIPQSMVSLHFKNQPEKLKLYLKDPEYQIKWALEYIARRHELGTPEKAVKEHNKKNWY